MDLEYFQRWLDLKSFSDQTKVKYLGYTKLFLDFSGGEISTELIEDYVIDLQARGRKPPTINIFINSVRAYCKAKNLDVVMPSLKRIKKAKHSIKPFFTEEDLTYILRYSTQWWPNNYQEMALILQTGFYTGLRSSSLLNLTPRNIDFKHREFVILDDKGNKDRYIPFFSKKLMCKLRKWTRYMKHDQRIFDVSYSQLKNALKKIQQEMNIRGQVEPRTLRRSFCYFCIEQGIDLAYLQELMGHEDVQTTLIYFRPTKDMIHKKAREIWDRS